MTITLTIPRPFVLGLVLGFALLVAACGAQSVDLREYFPMNSEVQLNRPNGEQVMRYSFFTGWGDEYAHRYNTGQPGVEVVWRKEYLQTDGWKVAVDQILFFGDDQSVIELGGWKPKGARNIAVGYKTYIGTKTTGLYWSRPGGITAAPFTREMKIFQQTTPGGSYEYRGTGAYSKSGLVEVLPTFTPKYGRCENGEWSEGCGKEYTDVVHVVLYHGVKFKGMPLHRCWKTPVAADGVYYQALKDYNSYAVELWLSKERGLIQERLAYFEDGTFWGRPPCGGALFDDPKKWTWYVDEGAR